MIVNDELGRIWKEEVVAYFMAIALNLLGRTEEGQDRSQPE
jgi:hypothetical protein